MSDRSKINFDEYLKQGEPGKADKAKAWQAAIGLQKVDGLTPSAYLINTARQNIEGDLSIEEVKDRIDAYYQQHPTTSTKDRTEEADKVSARIAEILGEQTFNFSPAGYLAIHRRLFSGIYEFAGKIRDYNISKKEWVLDGASILYASADSLMEALEYDIDQEKKFSYKGLNEQEVIEHLAHFISYLWQIHVFGEGNTRTTAIFLIKYLRKLGFKNVNNDLFEENSWYFRNALVRANYQDLSANIHKTDQHLIRFLSRLLGKEIGSLRNRELHIHFKKSDKDISKNDTANLNNDTVNVNIDTLHHKNGPVKYHNDTVNPKLAPVISLIKQDKHITATAISHQLNVSLSTVRRRLRQLTEMGKIGRVGSDKTGYWILKS